MKRVCTAGKRCDISFPDLPDSLLGSVLSCLNLADAIQARNACSATRVPISWPTLQDLDERGMHLSLRLCIPPLVKKVTNVPQITPGTVGTLSRLPNLTDLDLGNCESTTDGSILALGLKLKLRSLDLSQCGQVTDAGLAHVVANFPNLFELVINTCEAITSAGLLHLTGLPNLHTLHMDGCMNLCDVSLSHLRALKQQLRKMTITCCYDVTDTGIAYLCEITSLTHLTLGGLPLITDASLASLALLVNLVSLCFSGFRGLMQNGTPYIAALPRLKKLSFFHMNRLNDAGLAHLHTLPNLKHFVASYCQGITAQGVQALVVACGLVSLDPSHSYLVTGHHLLEILPNTPTLRTLVLNNWDKFQPDLQQKLLGFGVNISG